MAVNSTERQHEARCTLVKRFLLAFATTDTQMWFSMRPFHQRFRTSVLKSSWYEVSRSSRSVLPSPLSSANHSLTVNIQEWFVCLSKMTISSRSQDGLLPELSCPMRTLWISPSRLLTLRTKISVFPRAKIVFSGSCPAPPSWIIPVLSSAPYISIATLAFVPDPPQTPVVMNISYAYKLFEPDGSSTGGQFCK